MRLSRILLAAGTVSMLAACAGKSPVPSNAQVAPDLLASWKNGTIDQTRWDIWKTSAGVAPQTPASEMPRLFSDYVRYQLDAQAATDAGLTKEKVKADRWASIIDRILSDKVRRDFLGSQYGISDSAITKWAAGQDSTTRKLSIDSLRIRGGRALALVGANLDSVYKANKESFKKDSVSFKPLDSVKTQVQELYLRARTEKAMRDMIPDLRAKYAVKLVTPSRPAPSDDTLKAFWQKNQDSWSSASVYRVVALGSKDSAKLAKALIGVKDLAAFKKLAAKFPIGTPVAPEGVLGRVKHQFALPYGIGMVPALFPMLETAKVASLQAILKANDSLFIATWLDGRDTGAVKPFATVKADVRAQWEEANPWTPPASAILATWDKGNLYTKADVDFISEEVPAQMRRQFPADRVLEFMINWKISGRLAREVGLESRPEVAQAVSDNEKIFWAQEWRQTAQASHFLFEKKQTDSATTFWKDSLFTQSAIDSSKGVNRDGARLCLVNGRTFRDAYLVDLDKYRHDSTFSPYDSARGRIFSDMRATLDEQGRNRIDSVLKARYEFKLYPAAPQTKAPLAYPAALDSARAAHDRRALDEADALYRQIEKNTAAPDSVRAQALFQQGQLYGEQQNYPKSLSAYRSVLVRFPKSNEAYKAQFMIAFTYSEYLKNEKAALLEYGKMLSDYPKSDLTDDADWMIRNIKSGGALMPKFDDSAFVADSIARADSLKKATPKVDTAKKVVPVKADTTKAKPAAAKPVVAAAKVDTTRKVAPTKADSGKLKTTPVAAKADTTKAKPAAAKAAKAPKVDSAKKVVPAKADTTKAKAVVAKPVAKADTAKAGAKK